LTNVRYGPVSPAAQIEPILLIQAGQPLKPSEGVALANSLLQGSALEKQVRDFQRGIRKEPSDKLTNLW
jgi:hypothetical protein